ncbi:MAG: serine/threonine-protein kinase [Acidobacteriota bacterium]
MDSDRWQRVQALFHAASALPEAQQLTWLERECGQDEALLDEVLAMLAEDCRTGGWLDSSVAQIAGQMFAEPLVPPSAWQQIGPWHIEKVLGEGGMGTVFLARRADLGTTAAIKILRDAWISPARRERFAREQRTLARLDHVNIARLLDADTLAEGTPYFVMEYVDGLPLDQHCEARQCSLRRRLELFRSVCETVRFAHNRAVIHRDLKPSNILVTADGTVKLLDFGIAKPPDDLDSPADATRTGLRLMTPAYASPEQLRGEPATVQTDVYSLGVVLYQLVAGRLPSGDSPASPERDLNVLCLTAIHRDAGQRYASAEALIRDIDHFLRGEPLEARPDTLGYRLSKFVRRRRRALAAVVAVSLSASSLIVFFTLRLAAERNTALAEAARAQRIQQFTRNLFQGGDKDAGPANDLRVSTLIDRGVLEAHALDREPAAQGDLYQTLGDIHQKLGSLDRAETLLRAALKLRRSAPRPNPADVSETLVSLALLRMDEARLDDAERLVREGLDLSRRTLPAGHPAIAAATDALGRILEEKGACDRAIPVLEEAVRLRSGPAASPGSLASSLYELGNCYFYTGRYKDSEALNNRVLAMSRGLYGDRHPRVAEALVNLGAIQQDLGNYSRAEQFQRQALQITRSFYGEDHYRTASGLTLVARALVYQKRFDEAVDLLNQALAIQERVFGKVHPRVASALNELGNVAVMRGQLDRAKADFRRMGEIYRQVYGGRHYLIGIAASNLGSVFMTEKDNAKAERQFREALAMFAQTLPPDHLNTAIARIKLGRSLLRQRRFTEAEAETMAGYRILGKQANPSVSWLNSARTDLTRIYEALNQSGKAAAFREASGQTARFTAAPVN